MTGSPEEHLKSWEIPEDEASRSIELNRLLLTPIGVWPRSETSSCTRKLLGLSINVFCYSIIGFLLVSTTLYTLIDVQDLDMKLKMIGPLSFCMMAIAKYRFLLYREKGIKKCVQHLAADWRNATRTEEKRIMTEYADFGKRLTVVSAVFMFGGVFFYQAVMPLTSRKIVIGNLSFRQLAYPVSDIIVDAKSSPVNELMIPFQCVCGFVMNSITVGACSLAAVFATHACGQLGILMFWLEDLVDGRKDVSISFDTVDNRIADIVRQHVRVLSFVTLTEELLNEISLIEVVGCTVNMCFLGYYLITDWDYGEPIRSLTYSTLFVSFAFNIFIFCYIGELLVEQWKKVGRASYMIDWHRLKGNKGLALIMVIAMSESSIKLTAGKFVDLSLNSFGDVMKVSVAYLTCSELLLPESSARFAVTYIYFVTMFSGAMYEVR